MSHTKVIVDFSDYKAAVLTPAARRVHERMTENAATFGSPPLSMADFGLLVDAYEARLVARKSRSSADVLAYRTTRAELEVWLGKLGHYVNSVAKGDAQVCEKSGFPTYGTRSMPDVTPPAAPADLRLRHGPVSGGILARCKPARRPSSNEVQLCTGDPTDEAAWRHHGFFLGAKVLIEGLTPGVVVWVRIRTAGLKGVMGAWSDPAQIRVL